MHKEIDYCTYEMSVMLKNLGYKESSMWWYNTVVDYPEDGGEIEIKQLVKGNRWMDYNSWDECPEDFIIACPYINILSSYFRNKALHRLSSFIVRNMPNNNITDFQFIKILHKFYF